MYLSEQNV